MSFRELRPTNLVCLAFGVPGLTSLRPVQEIDVRFFCDQSESLRVAPAASTLDPLGAADPLGQHAAGDNRRESPAAASASMSTRPVSHHHATATAVQRHDMIGCTRSVDRRAGLMWQPFGARFADSAGRIGPYSEWTLFLPRCLIDQRQASSSAADPPAAILILRMTRSPSSSRRESRRNRG